MSNKDNSNAEEDPVSQKELLDVMKQQMNLLKTLWDENARLRSEGAVADGSRTDVGGSSARNISAVKNMLANSIPRYSFEVDQRRTFVKWYERYGSAIAEEEQLSDREKTRALLDRLDEPSYERYSTKVKPKSVFDFSYDNTVEELKSLFSVEKSKMATIQACLKISMSTLNPEDELEYINSVNEMVESAELQEMTIEDWKVHLAICGLDTPELESVRTFLMNYLRTFEKDVGRKPTLTDLHGEWMRLKQLKRDSAAVGQRRTSDWEVNGVRSGPSYGRSGRGNGWNNNHFENGSRVGPIVCFKCGVAGHMMRDCDAEKSGSEVDPVEGRTCYGCKKVGHLIRDCPDEIPEYRTQAVMLSKESGFDCDEFVEMERKYADVSINGGRVSLQLDTASDVTLIGRREWRLLGRPQLRRIDRTVMGSNDQVVELAGKFPCKFWMDGVEQRGFCYVRKGDGSSLLGLQWLRQSKKVKYLMDQMVRACQSAEMPKKESFRFLKAQSKSNFDVQNGSFKTGVSVDCRRLGTYRSNRMGGRVLAENRGTRRTQMVGAQWRADSKMNPNHSLKRDVLSRSYSRERQRRLNHVC